MTTAATYPAANIMVIEEAAPVLPPPRQELIHDKSEAWEYYQKFIKAEKKVRRRRAHVDALEFFGDACKTSLFAMIHTCSTVVECI